MRSNELVISTMKKEEVEIAKSLEQDLGISILAKESMLEDLIDSNFSYFSLKIEREMIGYIATSHVIDTMDILAIVIKKQYQKQGYASLLLDYILTYAKSTHIEYIILEVRKSNIPAQKLYEKFGFKKINERRHYYSDNHENAYIYKKIVVPT